MFENLKKMTPSLIKDGVLFFLQGGGHVICLFTDVCMVGRGFLAPPLLCNGLIVSVLTYHHPYNTLLF